ncbi:MAG: EAL domain-containing protein, partial [Pedobacter sp.]
MQNTNYLIGRQPILNRNEEIVAYELLFRSTGSRDSATVLDASQASASVIINTLSGFGLETILGSYRGFINLELDLLMSDSITILPKERVVLELLESLQVTPELVERCRTLKEDGFTLALDDHEFDPVYEELYSIIDIVKVDLILSPVEHLSKMVEHFSPYPVKLLAEKVETREEYLRCRDMGFELFQGYYFAKPSVMEKKCFDDSFVHLLKLMRLLNEDAEIDAIEEAFR